MKYVKSICCVAIGVGISLASANSAKAIKILMHGREPVPVFRDDPFVLMHLESVFGAENVDYIQGTEAAADGSSANGYDVVFLSSTMASSATRDKYEDSTVGVVTSENALITDGSVGNFFLVDNGGNADGIKIRREIDIVNPDHPLAAGLSGKVAVYNSTEPSNDPNVGTLWAQFGKGDLGTGVELIAEWDTTDQPDPTDPVEYAIFAADVGAALRGDGSPGSPATAAGRRVFFFMSDFGASDLTPQGMALFDAAINWAAATPPAGVMGDYNDNGVVDAADYVAWRDGGTLANEVATLGTVTPEDYDEWRSRFGNTAAVGSGHSVSGVPEPAGCVLTLIAIMFGTTMRRYLMPNPR
jgi:hypothetical protein